MTGDLSRDIYSKIECLSRRLDGLCELVKEIQDELSEEDVFVTSCGTDDNSGGVGEDL